MTPPTVTEMLTMYRRLLAVLKKEPFSPGSDRHMLVQEAEELLWYYEQSQNGGSGR